jgi:hypothetical protein
MWLAIRLLLVTLTVPTIAVAQDSSTRALSFSFQVQGGLPRTERPSFELFGRPSSIEFTMRVLNDSSETLVVPASFPTDVGIRVERDGRVVSAETRWEAVEVALEGDEPVQLDLMTPFYLAAQAVARFRGVVRPTASTVFSPGDYTVRLDLRRSVGGVRDGANKPWNGYYGREPSVYVRVTEPRTSEELRRSNLATANAAMFKGDAALSIKYYTEMLRVSPDDMDALSGLGQAYLELRRYKEAAAAFESAIARLARGERSGLYASAAYAYVALGDDVRAEAILAKAYDPESAKRLLVRIREAVGRR